LKEEVKEGRRQDSPMRNARANDALRDFGFKYNDVSLSPTWRLEKLPSSYFLQVNVSLQKCGENN